MKSLERRNNNMPRISRKKAFSRIYHVMLRGINKQNIFYNDTDKRKFLKILKNTKEKYSYEIYSYCLMDNHVHLLFMDLDQKISHIIQSIGISYALYFNKKYNRVGHLFQNRYCSRCVEDEKYLLNLVRYIHRNPENALIELTENYEWSSFQSYFYDTDLINSEFVLNLFDKDDILSKKKFKEFNLKQVNNYKDELEFEFVTCFSDEEAIKIIKRETNIDDLSKISIYNAKLRDEIIREIKKIDGISKIQISRILNLNRKIIERA